MNRRQWLIITLVLIVSAISFLRSFLGLIGAIPWNYGYSDVFNADRINPQFAMQVPYLESPIEYPVVTGFFIYLMWLIGKSLLWYAILTFVFLTLCAVITVLVLYKLCDLLKVDEKRLFWFFVFAPSLIIFGIYNWDIIAVMFTVLAIYLFYRNSYVWAAIFLGLGFNSKLFPAILLPIMLLKSGFKNKAKIASVFLLTFVALNIYFIINSFDVWKITYLFHTIRKPNIDSVWSLGSLSVNTANILSFALVSVFYLMLIRSHKKYDFLTLSFASFLLLFMFNKIFSPQYLLWLLPFFVLLPVAKKAFYLLEGSNLLVFFTSTYWIFVLKEQFILDALHLLTVIRALLFAYIAFAILKTSKRDIKQ